MGMTVLQAGVLSLLQDSGRYGHHGLGLANGGPLDREAFLCCNHLLQNPAGSTVIEVSVGGLQLRSETDTFICLSGASMPLSINGEARPPWAVHRVHPGDIIHAGHATTGCRAYLGVADGFSIAPTLGSTSTVPREGIGGLDGGALRPGDELPCPTVHARPLNHLPARYQPRYQRVLTVRVIPCAQRRAFSRAARRLFFSSAYQVSEHCDRMGYRLQGPPVSCALDGMLSEGISHGAIQIPPDGQPIVLLNDRQTIGGYPKIGTALSLDTSRLGQLTPGCSVHFAAITVDTARRALSLAQRFPPWHRMQVASV